MTETPPTTALIIIGNEILSGRTQDANLAYLATGLSALGLPLREVRVIADEEAAIIDAVNSLRRQHRYVFTTGGIGPTHDDITAAAIARAFDTTLHRHPEAVRILSGFNPTTPERMAARLKMAEMPVEARLIDNPVSKAPGFQIGNVFVLAGIPEIAHAMFDAVKATLTGGPPILSRTISSNLAESTVAADLGEIQKDFPATEIGSYPYFAQGHHGASFVVRGTDLAIVTAAVVAIVAMVRKHGAEPLE